MNIPSIKIEGYTFTLNMSSGWYPDQYFIRRDEDPYNYYWAFELEDNPIKDPRKYGKDKKELLPLYKKAWQKFKGYMVLM